MRRFLTQPQAQLLVQCVISSRIDYCNALLFGAQKVACINDNLNLGTIVPAWEQLFPVIGGSIF